MPDAQPTEAHMAKAREMFRRLEETFPDEHVVLYAHRVSIDGKFPLDFFAAALAEAVAAERERLQKRIDTLERMDREAATHVESTICMRTDFTGDPPYVGWKGLGLALTEALDERDRLRAALRARGEPTSPPPPATGS